MSFRLDAKYRAVSLGGSTHAVVTHHGDGSSTLRSTEALEPYPRKLTECLVRGAANHPERVFIAKRGTDGEWRKITYGEMLPRVRAIAQALAQRDLSADRPIAILSGNDLEHAQLALGAMWAGIPTCAVSPGYSLHATTDKLRHVLSVLTPGMVFAAGPEGYAAAIHAEVTPQTEVVLAHGELPGRPTTPFSNLTETVPGVAADQAHEAVTPETIAKFMFTSGSTKKPKAVVTTQRMLCSNQQMLLQCLRCLGEEPPVLVDWLPWNHTFGGSHNVGIALYNGGTLYIDDGKPIASLFGETLRNLREIAPTVYFNVPKGWEDLVTALEADVELCKTFFSRVKLLFYAAAALPQNTWDRLDRVAEATVGERIKMITGLGMTETAPSSLFTTGAQVRAGYVGLPAPGCETKLSPLGNKLEARFRGPHVMPGYWRNPDQTRQAFDDEGFYRTGDALRFVSVDEPDLGLFFDGRVTEDFKLSSGAFVSVGPLVQKIIAAGAPYVADAVMTGLNRNELGALIFPRVDTCRVLAGAAPNDTLETILAAPPVVGFFQQLIDRLAQSATGSSTLVTRALVLAEPPSFARGEITDKGSINQGAVLAQRAALIDAMHDGSIPAIHPRSPSDS